MKTCAYCGRENEDAVAVCAACGTGNFKAATTSSTEQPAVEREDDDLRLREILTEPVRLFRVLVIASTVAYLIWFFHLWLGVSQGTWEALSWRGYGALLRLPTSVAWLWMLLSVAVAVGLYGFSKSARLVFALLAIFGAFTTLLAGVEVHTAFGSFLLLLTNMADGAILLMAYTSPLKERFA